MSIEFTNTVGHTKNKDFLKKIINTERVPNAFLFTGPDGVGKNTLAIEFAKALNCKDTEINPCDKCYNCIAIDKNEFPDISTVDPLYNIKHGFSSQSPKGKESGNGLKKFRDEIERVIEESVFTPVLGKKKVFIIDDASYLSVPSSNNLLKILEEPPEYLHIILITSREDDILPTIISRCQVLNFKNLSNEDMRTLIEKNKIDNNDMIMLISSGNFELYKELIQGDYKKFIEITGIVMHCLDKSKDMYQVTEYTEKILKYFERKNKSFYIKMKEYFLFLKQIFKITMIDKKIEKELNDFYFYVVNLSRENGNINENLSDRLKLLKAVNSVISETLSSLDSYVNEELILTEFLRRMGGAIRTLH